eukprot:SAG11_NODE_75_length_18024_cov_5.885356_19_plen_67_part_00
MPVVAWRRRGGRCDSSGTVPSGVGRWPMQAHTRSHEGKNRSGWRGLPCGARPRNAKTSVRHEEEKH